MLQQLPVHLRHAVAHGGRGLLRETVITEREAPTAKWPEAKVSCVAPLPNGQLLHLAEKFQLRRMI